MRRPRGYVKTGILHSGSKAGEEGIQIMVSRILVFKWSHGPPKCKESDLTCMEECMRRIDTLLAVCVYGIHRCI